MNETVKAEDLLSYLQALLDEFTEDRKKYGPKDRIVQQEMHGMLACRDMVACLIGVPVNMQLNGKVTVGF